MNAEVHAHAATACRGDEGRERTAAVGTEQRPRRLDHQLERHGAGLEMEPRLEALEQVYQGGHFLGRRYLGQGDGEVCWELAAGPLDQRRHEQLERAGRARGSPGHERLDSDAEERRQARQAGRDLRTSGPRDRVLLLIRAVAEPVLEVDSEILDGLAPELLLQPREQRAVDVAIERRGERRSVRGILGQGPQRELTPLGGEPRSKQVRADVRRMDGAAPGARGSGRHARFPQKSRRSWYSTRAITRARYWAVERMSSMGATS